MAAHRFSVAIRLVNPGAVNEKRMEKDDISFLHKQIYLFSLEVLILLDAEIGLVYFAYFRVGVIIETSLMRFREDM